MPLIDDYRDKCDRLRVMENVLTALRIITPEPDAAVEIPSDFDLCERLDELISTFGEDVKEGHNKSMDRREIAEAIILAIDLRDELAGLAA